MKKIAITGSYAVGKTYILDLIKEMGYQIYNADNRVRAMYSKEKVQSELVDNVDKLANFDKEMLTELVFYDEFSRKQVESVMHPKIAKSVAKFAQEHADQDLLFYEIPLLFEANMQDLFDETVCVYCGEQVRIKRASARANYDSKIFEKINQIQMDQNMKRKQANYVINSDQEPVTLNKTLAQLIERLKND